MVKAETHKFIHASGSILYVFNPLQELESKLGKSTQSAGVL